jgi:iron(III) transport system ATP-binding protein
VTPAIRAAGIHKSFGATTAVDGADLEVARSELVALLGPSGSGKTTLLRVIAGFERPEAGTVDIGDRVVVGDGSWVEPEARHVGMVFQDGALFPHLTVAANVGFGEPREGRVEECLELVGLADRGRSYPHELSGGEAQRVALARALATEPEVVLLDEPFASLDASLRVALREEVVAILRAAGTSALLVTHDQQEALSVADVVVVMRDGRVEQAGPPKEIYDLPANRWVAEFLGAADVLPGTVTGGVVDCELGRFPAGDGVSGAVEVVIRPECLGIEAADPDDGGTTATVVERAYFGHDQLLALELASGRRIHTRLNGTAPWQPGNRVRIRVEGPVTVLPASPTR